MLPELRSAASRQPMFWATLAFAMGIWISHYAWRPPGWWVVATCVFAAAAICFLQRRPWLAAALTFLAFTFAGALAGQCSATKHGAGGWVIDDETTVTAHVVTEGNLESDGHGSSRQQIDIETEQLEWPGYFQHLSIGLRLNAFSKSTGSIFPEEEEASGDESPFVGATAMRLFHYGERIRFTAALITPRNFRNPGAFDYAGYLREQGISATASVKYSAIKTLPGFHGNGFDLWRARVRRSIVNSIHRLWPDRIAGLVEAMVIGERSFVTRNDRTGFQRAGTYHMLVVAGLHVGILAAFVLWLMRLLGCSDIAASGAAMVLIFAYALITGEGAPVWRAALMFAVYLATRLLYRQRAMLNALALAAMGLLLANPDALFTAGFQMTILCIVLIAGIAIPLVEQTIDPYMRGLRNLDAVAYDRSLSPRVAQFRIDLRLVASRLDRVLPDRFARGVITYSLRVLFGAFGLVVISAVMQFGLALPMAYYFHRATSVAIPANLLLVPLMQLLMPAAAMAIALSYVSIWLAKIPAAFAGFALSGIAQAVRWLGGMRIADIRVPAPSVVVIGFAVASIAVAITLARQKRVRWSMLAIGVLMAGAISVWKVLPTPSLRVGVLEMSAIDVGQGDSIFLSFPGGAKMLVDGGGMPFWTHSQMAIGEDVVSPYLWARGISRLDVVVLTHAHQDHMGGLPAVLANFRPRELWMPEGIQPGEISDLLAIAERYGVKVVRYEAGDQFPYSGTMVRVLAPDPAFPVRVAHRNDESLVMKITYGNTSALLAADAEKGTEKLLSTEDPAADVLKVAHHGSASSTNEGFLAAVHPRYAVISVGPRNVYRHPRIQVLERLESAGVATYRTDVNGAETFYLDGFSVTPRSPDLR